MYNPFCKYCVGGRGGEQKEEIKSCNDRKCPFYDHKRTLLEWQTNIKPDKTSKRAFEITKNVKTSIIDTLENIEN